MALTGRDGDSTGTTSARLTRGAANSTSSDSPTLFPLETSPRSTAGRLWPTPRGQDGKHGEATEYEMRERWTTHPQLHMAIKKYGSSPEASPVRTSPQPVRVPGSLEHVADSGLNMLVLLARYDLATRSWRTSGRSLDGDLIEFSGRWPKSGTMRNGVTYELPMSVRRTAGNASGLWRTPNATDGDHGGPNARDSGGGLHLTAQVTMWPTPTTRDHKDGTNVENVPENCLLGRAVKPTPEGGSLNPEFVEWLMGYSSGWTDSRDSATRLSLRLQNSSSDNSIREGRND